MSKPKDPRPTASGPSHITAALHGEAEERLAEPTGGAAQQRNAAHCNDGKENELQQRAVKSQVNEVIEKGE